MIVRMPGARVLVLIGPSASGKSTLARALQAAGVVEVTPSWTTRPRREDEMHGSLEHRFVSDEAFTALERAGFFAGVVRMFGLPYRYGLRDVAAPPPGRVPLVIARASVLPIVAALFPEHVVYQVEGPPRRSRGPRRESRVEQCAAGRAAADRVFLNTGTVPELIEAVAAAIAQDFLEEVTCGRSG